MLNHIKKQPGGEWPFNMKMSYQLVLDRSLVVIFGRFGSPFL